jgi:hypothetical protein
VRRDKVSFRKLAELENVGGRISEADDRAGTSHLASEGVYLDGLGVNKTVTIEMTSQVQLGDACYSWVCALPLINNRLAIYW